MKSCVRKTIVIIPAKDLDPTQKIVKLSNQYGQCRIFSLENCQDNV